MMSKSLSRWLLTALRFALCVAAIVYLVYNVSWYDHVHMAGPKGARLRLLSAPQGPGDPFTVLRDGQRVEVAADALRTLPKSTEPEIEYGIVSVVQRMDLGMAALALLLFGPVPLLQSVRLVWMLAVQAVKLTIWQAIKLSYAGNFFNFAMPGTVGGDLVKAYYITRFTHHKTEAVTSVFLDRVIGLLGLTILGAVVFVFSLGRVEWDAELFGTLATIFFFVAAGLVVGTILVFSRRVRRLLRLSEIAARLPAGQHLLRIGRATVAMRSHKTLVGASIVNTIILQAFVVVSAFVMARSLGMRGQPELYFVCVPIGFLIAAIPISPPQAFGVMEWAYVLCFTRDGLNTPSQAVAFALALRLTQLVWALPGVLVPLLGAHLPRANELRDFESSPDDTATGNPAESFPQPAPSK